MRELVKEDIGLVLMIPFFLRVLVLCFFFVFCFVFLWFFFLFLFLFISIFSFAFFFYFLFLFCCFYVNKMNYYNSIHTVSHKPKTTAPRYAKGIWNENRRKKKKQGTSRLSFGADELGRMSHASTLRSRLSSSSKDVVPPHATPPRQQQQQLRNVSPFNEKKILCRKLALLRVTTSDSSPSPFEEQKSSFFIGPTDPENGCIHSIANLAAGMSISTYPWLRSKRSHRVIFSFLFIFYFLFF